VGSWGLEIDVVPARDLRGHLTGILGNFDSHGGNDLVTRAGQAIKNPPPFHDLYQEFGDSWRIHQSESLFDYAPGQSTATFTNRRLPSQPIAAASLPNGQAAIAICRSLGVTTPERLRACALDVAVTGQAAFSDSAMASQSLSNPGCAGLSYTAPTRATMAAGAVDEDAVARGIRYLQTTQKPDGFWPEEHYTGGGFPRVFYLRYHGYAKFFPLWALARCRNLRSRNSAAVTFGM